MSSESSLDLSARPFHLRPEDIEWVTKTCARMTLDERIGQLFCLCVKEDEDEKSFDRIFEILAPGGFMLMPRRGAVVQRLHRHLQSRSPVPLLLAANLEQGGNGIATDGTHFSSSMGVAATDDEGQAYRLGVICGKEARAVGCNWAFAPVVDIDYNFQNPITNTRTFGSDPSRVLRLARAYIRGLREQGVAACAKHWPGDGVDGRDQHLVSSVNSMSVAEWERTFGRVFAGIFEDDLKSVMAAHILLPNYSRSLRPGLPDDKILPATLAPEITEGLLRRKLGFNGLIITDASLMVGFTAAMARRAAVPATIAAGCDMFLFTIDLEEDLEAMRAGIQDGALSEARLEEAVLRILAFKASLGLHRQKEAGSLVPQVSELSVLCCAKHEEWARECASRAVTLVKGSQQLFPLSPERQRRILVHVLGDNGGYLATGGGNAKLFVQLMQRAGFLIELFNTTDAKQAVVRSASESQRRYDLIIYFASLRTASGQTAVRIDWGIPFGFDAPRYLAEIPTLFISIDNPYHLQDVPRIRTFINGYTSNPYVVEAIVEKLLGRSAFVGQSPVDPFCGYWDARL